MCHGDTLMEKLSMDKCVHDELANEQLVGQLRKFREYLLCNDAPEWQQLIAVAGFVTDTVKTLRCNKTDEIHDEIIAAVNYELEKPYAEKLNSMWDDWNFNRTGKYANVKTVQEMLDIICDCLEIEYPGLMECEKRFFGLSMKFAENEDESQ